MSASKLPTCFIAATSFAVAQSAGAVGLPDVPNAHTDKQLSSTTSFTDAMTGGEVDLSLRLRHENVSDDIPPASPLAGTEDAEKLHLRTALGYTTQRFRGFYSRLQFEDGSRIGRNRALNLDTDFTFPPGPQGSRIAEGHALIPDNKFTEINEAYLGFRAPDTETTVKLGRQTVIYDNHRWVGNIVWRQNHMSYDAFRIDNTSIPNLGLSYAYVDTVNRTFGPTRCLINGK